MVDPRVVELLETMESIGRMSGEEDVPGYKSVMEKIEQARKKGNKHEEADGLQQMGLLLMSVGQTAHSLAGYFENLPEPAEILEQAIAHFNDSIPAAESVGDEKIQKSSLFYIGNCLIQLDRFEEALSALEPASDYFERAGNSFRFQHYETLWRIGDCYLELERDEESFNYYQRSLAIAREIGDPFEEATQLGKAASALGNLKRHAEALEYYQLARGLYRQLIEDERLQEKVVVHRHLFSVQGLRSVLDYTDERIATMSERNRISLAIAALPKSQIPRFRHARHYRELLREISRSASQAESPAALPGMPQFEREWEQIQSGQRWAAEQVSRYEIAADMSIDYASTAVSFRTERTSAQERLRWSAAGLAAAKKLQDREEEARLLINAAYDKFDLGRTDAALEDAEQALSTSLDLGLEQVQANALLVKSNLLNDLGRFGEAMDMLEERKALVDESDEEIADPQYLSHLVGIYQNTGDYAQALKFGELDLEGAKQEGDTSREAKALGNLGLLYHSMGQFQKAIEYHERALSLARQLGDKPAEVSDLLNAGASYMELERFEEATQRLEEALSIAREFDFWHQIEGALGNLGHLYRMMGSYEAAFESFKEAMEVAVKRGHRAGEANALQGMGNVSMAQKEFEKARDHYMRSLQIAQEIGYREAEIGSLLSLGQSYVIAGERYEDALQYIDECLALARPSGAKLIEGRALLARASILKAMDRTEEALNDVIQGRAIFQSLNLEQEIQAADVMLSMVIRPDNSEPASVYESTLFKRVWDWSRIPAVDILEMKSYLVEHQDVLLTDEAESVLKLIIRSEPDNQKLKRQLQLLEECRTEGIDDAFEKAFTEIAVSVAQSFDSWLKTPDAQPVIEKVVEWSGLPDKQSSKEYLLQNKDSLLTIHGMMLVGLMGEQAEEGYRYQQLSKLLDFCRKHGIEAAYEEFDALFWHQELVSLVTNWFQEPVKEYLIQHKDRLLTEEAEYVLSGLLEMKPNWAFELYLNLIRQAQVEGIDVAVEAFQQAESAHQAEEMSQLFMEWIGKSSWEESKAFLEEHDNQMVSPLGLDIIQRVAQAMPEEPVIQKHLLILTRAMSLGIDETYESMRLNW